MHYRSEQAKPGAYATEPPSFLRMVLLALALFALTLPIAGPLDDHHFAERSHNHQHIYLDGKPAEHRHVFDTDPRHWHAGPSDSTTDPYASERGDGVAYLTGATASLTLAVTNAPYHPAPEALRPPSAYDEGDNPLSDFAARYHHPEGRRLAPPQPPPIA